MMTRRRLAILLVAGLLPAALAAQDSDRSRLEFYKNAYTELRPETDPRAGRAQEIFARLLKAAGTRSGLVPRLFIAKNTSPPPPAAIAIPDGGIIISERMLDVCYQQPERGDDRLAYILAHEIAHQLKNDFWPVTFFQAVDLSRTNDPKNAPALDAVKKELALGDEAAAAEQRRKELQADEMGAVFASMAGFDTRAVVMEDDKINLFRFVETNLDPANIQGVTTDASHPTADVRAAVVKARLEKVLDALDLFDTGLLFYRTGDYERAAALFAEFLREYPGREVYHDLAACHQQIALKSYREWRKGREFPFKLVLTVESETRARSIRLRAAGADPESRFREEMSRAVEYERQALALDPAFWPAANNLGCALIMLDEPYEAAGILQKALPAAPESPLLLNNLGVALELAENRAKAKERLRAALTAGPDSDAPLFNLGRIAALENDAAEAKRQWDAYLQKDPDSVWAGEIRQALGAAPAAPATAPGQPAPAPESISGLTTQNYDDEIPAAWGAPARKKQLLGEEDGFVLRIYAGGIQVVSDQDEILRLCAVAPYKGKTAAGAGLGAAPKDLTALYGRPEDVLVSNPGETWVYPARGIAFVLVDGKVASWILFKRS
jgi:tetratricopeptide (TPR) repeat protein